MGSSAPPLLLITFLFTLSLVSLSSNGCRASSLLKANRHHFLGSHTGATGTLHWQLIRSRVRGEAYVEEEKDMLEALHELEQAVPDDDGTETDAATQEEGAEDEEGGEDREERHPAEELLERQQADATISYILGGY